MKGFLRNPALYASLLLALTLSVAGCKGNQNANNNQNASNQPATDQSQQAADQADQAAQQIQSDQNDPANANVVPISNTTTGTSETAASAPASRPATSSSATSGRAAAPSSEQAPSSSQSAAFSPAQYNENNGYGQEPEMYAEQPPPELPQYQQPICPGVGFIWTPGHWGWVQPGGYYWIPGAWVRAPYQGALWTPGYWGWRGGRYAWYRGYWGRHIGYYGGINYGFGYVGFGYQGGYWHGNDFMYNRTVNNINVTVVRNVYNYRVINVTNTRVSFNGGNGGVRYRPRPVELVATVREQHNPPMQTQIEIRMNAQRNQQNFVNVNHGRPAVVVVDHAVQADRNVRPPAPVRYDMRPQQPGQPVPHPAQPQPQRVGQPNRPQPNHPQQNPPLQRNDGKHPAHQPTPQHGPAGAQHGQPNHPGQVHGQQAHPDHANPNNQKNKDQKKKPENQRPQ